MVFYTSELMLNDGEYLRKSNRHFSTALSMTNHIITSWNRVVSDSDDVFILGGVGDFEYLKSLNGNKKLIMSASEKAHYEGWRKTLSDEPDEELDSELYEKHLLTTYGIVGVNFGGRMIKKTSTGKLIRLVTDKDFAKLDTFNVYGCIGDFQKMVSSGINASIAVHNYSPLSESELEYYFKSMEKLI